MIEVIARHAGICDDLMTAAGCRGSHGYELGYAIAQKNIDPEHFQRIHGVAE
ncbi:MAG TPA: hypothetical protein VD978_31505 [Azospirillum sp.]|nr:hypothetical protein [Azospirillum sp.]